MRRLLLFALVLAAWAATGFAFAQSSGGPFAVTHSVVTPGATMSGGSFGLSGTAGQAAASNTAGGSFGLLGGFSATSIGDRIFANGFEP
jgi:hypothetical protein